MIEIHSSDSKSGSGLDWLFWYGATKLGDTFRAESDHVETDRFYVMIFEAVWDGVAYWVTIAPSADPVELIGAVDDKVRPRGGNLIKTFESLWTGYEGKHN